MLIGLVIYFVAYGAALVRAFRMANYDQIWNNPHGLNLGFVIFSTITMLIWLGYLFIHAFYF